jgi:hypothetical protein
MTPDNRVAALGFIIVGLAAGLAAAAVARGTERQDVAGTQVPVVVELFTSEGCSSCPPADQLLTNLVGTQPIKEALVIGLSEHVDYWDRQGWKDPFSDRLFTQRQSAYAAAVLLSDIYTPQVIVDGADAVVGNDRAAVVSAIRRAASRRKVPIALAWSSTGPQVSITIDKSPETANATVFLAVTEDGLRSSVARGENAGRTLEHSAVTRRLSQIGKADKEGKFTSVVPVTFAPTWKRGSTKVIVFVQSDATRRIAAVAAIGAQGEK